jgi:hypothetical protein
MAGKEKGKLAWAGQRRAVTRKSGFASTSDVRYRTSNQISLEAGPENPIIIEFRLPATPGNRWVGWGGYCYAPAGTSIEVSSNRGKHFVGDVHDHNWTKFGGLWLEDEKVKASDLVLTITPRKVSKIGLYDFASGLVENIHLENSRKSLLKGMHLYAPEANFYKVKTDAKIKTTHKIVVDSIKLTTKSCNRCGRYLPINTNNELQHLAFTNHCKARRPCIHTGFGKILQEKSSDQFIQLEYGYQLECRFCKKFEVNGALNPQRTAGQMKEDGARRRHFELLLDHLYEGSPQLRYKNKYGRDLAQDIWIKFNRKCFKCNADVSLYASKLEDSYNLDHTRPLALLWPLDETATCLCKSCNSSKRDRYPSDFYSADELVRLSSITGIPLEELNNPQPNLNALALIDARREWLYETFLNLPDLRKVRDGKRTSDLVLKALDRVIDFCPNPGQFEKFGN